MKKIQVILAAVAIFAAGAGVFANARIAFATIYYRTADAFPNTPGANCGVVVTLPPGCSDTSGSQCFATYSTKLPGEVVATNKTYYISKTVDSNPCIIVERP